jgi:hypothetical protein
MTTTSDLPRPRFARTYLRTAKTAERRGATEHRRRLLDGLRGTVLELGAGHGLNFPHYPSTVTQVIAVEPEPALRAAAVEAAPAAPVPIRVLPGVAEELPLEDESVDAAVASLVLCSVPDHDHALAELRRVLRPGGELRFYEQVIPNCQPSASSSSSPTTAASGPRSPAAATPPATPAPPSSGPASGSRQATDSRSPPPASSQPFPISSAPPDDPEPRVAAARRVPGTQPARCCATCVRTPCSSSAATSRPRSSAARECVDSIPPTVSGPLGIVA